MSHNLQAGSLNEAMAPGQQGESLAVIGGGIAGITAAWLLQDRYRVTLFEAAPGLGGHAHAVEVAPGRWLDSGFIIFNTTTYPLYQRLLTELGVRDLAREMTMSFAFCDHDKDLHYAIHQGLGGLLHQPRNLRNPAFYRLFADLLRFRRQALRDLSGGRGARSLRRLTLKDYLAGYGPLFRENFLIPMAMAIWSLPAEHIETFPARTLLEFFYNHSLLRGSGATDDAWLSFSDSSRVYVEAFQRQFSGTLRLATPIETLDRSETGALVRTTAGESLPFDKLVIATHADTALGLFAAPTRLERQLLGAWRYQRNPVTLHTDARMMHPDRRIWSSWNISRHQGRYQVSYYLNQVHNLKMEQDYFLTLGETLGETSGGARQPAPDTVIARFSYDHPVFDFAALQTRSELPRLNGHADAHGTTFFCGSYFGYGFHEDAVRAADAVSLALGGRSL